MLAWLIGEGFVLLLAGLQDIPPELFDAARGCGAVRTWWSIGLPQVRPALTASAAIAFVFAWNDFAHPLLYISDQEHYTLPVALQSLQQMHPSRWSLLLAGAVVVTLPAPAAFAVAQRLLTGGFREPRPDRRGSATRDVS
jgi:multiple sugar transport system permease protein